MMPESTLKKKQHSIEAYHRYSEALAAARNVGYGVDKLSTGCQPFQVAYAGSANPLQAMAAASIRNQEAQGKESASLANYWTLQGKVNFPQDTVDKVSVMLGRFAVLCQTLFQGIGLPNPLGEALWQLTAAIQNRTLSAIHTMPAIATLYFLHAVQVRVHENWVPLPEEYYLEAAVRGGSRTPSTVPRGASSASSARTDMSSLTGNSVESVPTPVARVDNPSPDTEFSSITVRPGGTRPILRDHRPPANDTGNEFCVVWWLRGG
ncbi:hypothetical protein MHU86_6980 [Fragilaria crotonensis]|nr:hypothetical protein MHU86_6980 [Fragilaria crotonensis]